MGINSVVLVGSAYHTELIDGLEVEKPLPKRLHGILQAFISAWLLRHLPDEFDVMSELNILCGADRLVPDIVVAQGSATYVNEDLAEAPLLGVEILSPGQTVSEMMDKCTRLLRFGTRACWIVDPVKRRAWNCTPDDLSETGPNFPELLFGVSPEDGQLRAAIRLPAEKLWAEVNRRQR